MGQIASQLIFSMVASKWQKSEWFPLPEVVFFTFLPPSLPPLSLSLLLSRVLTEYLLSTKHSSRHLENVSEQNKKHYLPRHYILVDGDTVKIKYNNYTVQVFKQISSWSDHPEKVGK